MGWERVGHGWLSLALRKKRKWFERFWSLGSIRWPASLIPSSSQFPIALFPGQGEDVTWALALKDPPYPASTTYTNTFIKECLLGASVGVSQWATLAVTLTIPSNDRHCAGPREVLLPVSRLLFCFLKSPWCQERLRARGEGDNRGWDVWMASLTQWIWVWANTWDNDGQRSLVWCSSWGHELSDWTAAIYF